MLAYAALRARGSSGISIMAWHRVNQCIKSTCGIGGEACALRAPRGAVDVSIILRASRSLTSHRRAQQNLYAWRRRVCGALRWRARTKRGVLGRKDAAFCASAHAHNREAKKRGI